MKKQDQHQNQESIISKRGKKKKSKEQKSSSSKKDNIGKRLEALGGRNTTKESEGTTSIVFFPRQKKK